MTEQETFSETPFNEIPIETDITMELRQKFIDSAKGRESPEGVKSKLIGFIEKLEEEADEKFPEKKGASRVEKLKRTLWFNFQLVQAYADAEMWSQALKAAYDAEELAIEAREGENIFINLEKKFFGKAMSNYR